MRLIRQIYTLSALIFLIISFSSCSLSHKSTTIKPLTSEWKFCYDSVWYPATVPGSIHTDLIKNNIIKDPFWGTNEDSVQWISDRSWKYKISFDKKDLKICPCAFLYIECSLLWLFQFVLNPVQ